MATRITTVADVRRMLAGKPLEETAEVSAGEAAPVNATDSARELAEEHGIDLSTVTGTGADGRIILSDIKALI